MTGVQYAGLGSSILGAIGTTILFFNSYTLEPFEGAVFGSPSVTEHNNRVRIRNSRRLFRQRFGFALLCASFVVQAISYIL